jgi:F-type H+-transporting ATPase subunit epsilon
MYLKIVTPEKVIYDDQIDALIAPTVTGEIAILPHHIDLITQLKEGEMTIKTKGREQHLAVTGGFLQVQNDLITVLADYAVRSEEIDTQKALEAQRRAEEILKRKREEISEKDFAIAQADLRRALLELKVAKRRRRGTTLPHSEI